MIKNGPLAYWISIPAVIIFIGGFRLVFGISNSSVGLMFFMALVIFSHSTQIEIHPLRDAYKIFLATAAIAISSYVASLNPYTGLIINLIAFFVIVYFLFGSFQNILYIPAILGYLYMLSAPEPLAAMPMRLLAIAVGTLFFSLGLYAYQKSQKAFSVSAKLEVLMHMSANKARELAGMSDLDVVFESTIDIRRQISSLLADIYRHQSRNMTSHVLDEARVSLALALERFVTTIQEIKHTRAPELNERFALSALAALLDDMPADIDSHDTLADYIARMNSFIRTWETRDDLTPELFEILETCHVTVRQLQKMDRELHRGSLAHLPIKKTPTRKKLAQALRPNKLRLGFAIKYAAAVSVLYFAAVISGFEHAQWVAITVAFLIRPYAEDTSRRSRQRLKGTLIATGLFLLLFTVVDSWYLQLGAIMLANLIYSRAPRPSTQMAVWATFSALSSMALLSPNYTTLGAERVIFVLIGVAVTYLVNRFVFPYRVAKSSAALAFAYRHITYDMLQLSSYLRIHRRTPSILAEGLAEGVPAARAISAAFEGLIINASVIEQQIAFNNRLLGSDAIMNFCLHQEHLVADIHFFFTTLRSNTAKREVVAHLLHELEDIVYFMDEIEDEEFFNNADAADQLDVLSSSVDAAFSFTPSREVKMALVTMRRIVAGLRLQLEIDLSEKALSS